MNYKIRPGITLEDICGAKLLIPTRAASKDCPKVIRLGRAGVLVWNIAEGRLPRELVEIMLMKAQKKSRDEISAGIDKMQRDLCEMGFLIKSEDPGHDER